MSQRAGTPGWSRYRGGDGGGTDRALISACREGKTGAWEALLTKYERLVFSIPLNYGLSRADAADISQLTFTILIQSLESLDDDSRLGAWLGTVARRHAWRLMERRRREGTGKKEDLAESATLVAEPDGADSLKRWEQIEWLDHGLGLLDERCRELLTLLYLDPQGFSYAEVAERLNMPLGSIGPTRARCLERMKRALLGE